MNSPSTSTKRLGSSQLGEVTRVLKDLQTTGEDLGVRAVGVGDGDQYVVLTPDEEHRRAFGQVQAISGVDPLAAGLDDRAQRAQERFTGDPAERYRSGPLTVGRPARAGRGKDVGARAGPMRQTVGDLRGYQVGSSDRRRNLGEEMPRYLVERVWSVEEEEMAVKGPLSKRILAENEQFSPSHGSTVTWSWTSRGTLSPSVSMPRPARSSYGSTLSCLATTASGESMRSAAISRPMNSTDRRRNSRYACVRTCRATARRSRARRRRSDRSLGSARAPGCIDRRPRAAPIPCLTGLPR